MVLLLLLGGVGIIQAKAKGSVVGLVGEVVAEKGGLGVSDVEVAPECVNKIRVVYSLAQNLRRLGKESCNDALLGVLQSKGVACTSLAGSSNLGLGGGLLGLDLVLNLGVVLLDELKPPGKVDESAALDGRDGRTVAAESSPDLCIKDT